MNWWSELSIAHFWRWSDLVQRAIILGLTLMVGHTLFILVRFVRRYYLVCNEFRHAEDGSDPDFRRKARGLIAGLRLGLETLRAIATFAPFLGLAGTCYGILASFGNVMGSRASIITWLVGRLAEAPLTTLAGILVALPPAFSHNLLRTRVETLSKKWLPHRNPNESYLGSFQFAQALPLKKRISGLPPYAFLAAPFFALVVMVYMGVKLYGPPTGLPVRLLPMGSADRGGDTVKPVVVAVVSRVNDIPVVRVNSREVPWDKLEDVAQETLQQVPEPEAFVEADEGVLWTHVAYVIDTLRHLHYRVILLTTNPAPVDRGHHGLPKIPVAPPKPLR